MCRNGVLIVDDRTLQPKVIHAEVNPLPQFHLQTGRVGENSAYVQLKECMISECLVPYGVNA